MFGFSTKHLLIIAVVAYLAISYGMSQQKAGQSALGFIGPK